MRKAKWNKSKRGVATWAHFEDRLDAYIASMLSPTKNYQSHSPLAKNLKEPESQKLKLSDDHKQQEGSDNAVVKKKVLRKEFCLEDAQNINREEIYTNKQRNKRSKDVSKGKKLPESNKYEVVKGEKEEAVKGTERGAEGGKTFKVQQGKAKGYKSIRKEREEEVIHLLGESISQGVDKAMLKEKAGLLKGYVGLEGVVDKEVVETGKETPSSEHELLRTGKRRDSEEGKYEQYDVSVNAQHLKSYDEKSAKKEIGSKPIKGVSIQKRKSGIQAKVRKSKSKQEPSSLKTNKENLITLGNLEEATFKSERKDYMKSQETAKPWETEKKTFPADIVKEEEWRKMLGEVKSIGLGDIGTLRDRNVEASVEEGGLMLETELKGLLRAILGPDSEIRIMTEAEMELSNEKEEPDLDPEAGILKYIHRAKEELKLESSPSNMIDQEIVKAKQKPVREPGKGTSGESEPEVERIEELEISTGLESDEERRTESLTEGKTPKEVIKSFKVPELKVMTEFEESEFKTSVKRLISRFESPQKPKSDNLCRKKEDEKLEVKEGVENYAEEECVSGHPEYDNSEILSVQDMFKETACAGDRKVRFVEEPSMSHCEATEPVSNSSLQMLEGAYEKAEEPVLTKKLDMQTFDKTHEEVSRDSRKRDKSVDILGKEGVKLKEDTSGGFEVQEKVKSENDVIENIKGKTSGHRLKSPVEVEHGKDTYPANITGEDRVSLQIDNLDMNASAFKEKKIEAVQNEMQMFEIGPALNDDVNVLSEVEGSFGSDQVEMISSKPEKLEKMERTQGIKSSVFDKLDLGVTERGMKFKAKEVQKEGETKRMSVDEMDQGYLELMERELCSSLREVHQVIDVIKKKFEEIDNMELNESLLSEELQMDNISENSSALSPSKFPQTSESFLDRDEIVDKVESRSEILDEELCSSTSSEEEFMCSIQKDESLHGMVDDAGDENSFDLEQGATDTVCENETSVDVSANEEGLNESKDAVLPEHLCCLNGKLILGRYAPSENKVTHGVVTALSKDPCDTHAIESSPHEGEEKVKPEHNEVGQSKSSATPKSDLNYTVGMHNETCAGLHDDIVQTQSIHGLAVVSGTTENNLSYPAEMVQDGNYLIPTSCSTGIEKEHDYATVSSEADIVHCPSVCTAEAVEHAYPVYTKQTQTAACHNDFIRITQPESSACHSDSEVQTEVTLSNAGNPEGTDMKSTNNEMSQISYSMSTNTRNCLNESTKVSHTESKSSRPSAELASQSSPCTSQAKISTDHCVVEMQAETDVSLITNTETSQDCTDSIIEAESIIDCANRIVQADISQYRDNVMQTIINQGRDNVQTEDIQACTDSVMQTEDKLACTDSVMQTEDNQSHANSIIQTAINLSCTDSFAQTEYSKESVESTMQTDVDYGLIDSIMQTEINQSRQSSTRSEVNQVCNDSIFPTEINYGCIDTIMPTEFNKKCVDIIMQTETNCGSDSFSQTEINQTCTNSIVQTEVDYGCINSIVQNEFVNKNSTDMQTETNQRGSFTQTKVNQPCTDTIMQTEVSHDCTNSIMQTESSQDRDSFIQTEVNQASTKSIMQTEINLGCIDSLQTEFSKNSADSSMQTETSQDRDSFTQTEVYQACTDTIMQTEINRGCIGSIVQTELNKKSADSIMQTEIGQDRDSFTQIEVNQISTDSIMQAESNLSCTDSIVQTELNKKSADSIMQTEIGQDRDSFTQIEVNQISTDSIMQAESNVSCTDSIVQTEMEKKSADSIVQTEIGQDRDSFTQIEVNQISTDSIMQAESNVSCTGSIVQTEMDKKSADSIMQTEIGQDRDSFTQIEVNQISTDSIMQAESNLSCTDSIVQTEMEKKSADSIVQTEIGQDRDSFTQIEVNQISTDSIMQAESNISCTDSIVQTELDKKSADSIMQTEIGQDRDSFTQIEVNQISTDSIMQAESNLSCTDSIVQTEMDKKSADSIMQTEIDHGWLPLDSIIQPEINHGRDSIMQTETNHRFVESTVQTEFDKESVDRTMQTEVWHGCTDQICRAYCALTEQSKSSSRHTVTVQTEMGPKHCAVAVQTEMSPKHSTVAVQTEMDLKQSTVAVQTDMNPKYSTVAVQTGVDLNCSTVAVQTEMNPKHFTVALQTEIDPKHSSVAVQTEMKPKHSTNAVQLEVDPKHSTVPLQTEMGPKHYTGAVPTSSKHKNSDIAFQTGLNLRLITAALQSEINPEYASVALQAEAKPSKSDVAYQTEESLIGFSAAHEAPLKSTQSTHETQTHDGPELPSAVTQKFSTASVQTEGPFQLVFRGMDTSSTAGSNLFHPEMPPFFILNQREAKYPMINLEDIQQRAPLMADKESHQPAHSFSLALTSPSKKTDISYEVDKTVGTVNYSRTGENVPEDCIRKYQCRRLGNQNRSTLRVTREFLGSKQMDEHQVPFSLDGMVLGDNDVRQAFREEPVLQESGEDFLTVKEDLHKFGPGLLKQSPCQQEISYEAVQMESKGSDSLNNMNVKEHHAQAEPKPKYIKGKHIPVKLELVQVMDEDVKVKFVPDEIGDRKKLFRERRWSK